MKTTKREIAKLAFCKLRADGKKEAALCLADSLISSNGIVLSFGDVDTDIQNALEYCAGTFENLFAISPRAFARMCFDAEFEITPEQAKKNRVEFYD